jgi:exosome complex RNA-binding protein Rrp42 (RNase PH superfamily)
MGFLANNVRSDGRFFLKCRPTTITRGVLKRNAAGSSLVCLGNTQVMAAVSPCVGTVVTPTNASASAASEIMGDIIVVSENDSTYLQRILTGCIPLQSLSITTTSSSSTAAPKKMAWRLQIVIFVLNNDGNVRDASLIAAVAALKDTILPPVTVNNSKDGVVQLLDIDTHDDDNKNGTPLSLSNIFIPLTVGICNCSSSSKRDNGEEEARRIILLCDVTTEEEILVETKITMVVHPHTGEILNVESTGRITSQQLALVAKMARGRAQEVLQLLE